MKVTIELTPELAQAVKAAAQAEYRTVSGQIQYWAHIGRVALEEHQTSRKGPCESHSGRPPAQEAAPTEAPTPVHAPVLFFPQTDHRYAGWMSFPPLDQVTKPTLTTDEAAHYLNRRPQTLRMWAMREDGPTVPTRLNGRLAWSTVAIKALTNPDWKSRKN